MLTFKKLLDTILEYNSKELSPLYKGSISIQVFSGQNPFTAVISSNGKPLTKIQLDTSGIYTLYFQKKDIPYEIGYTGYEFHETDTIDKLLAKDILSEYPIAKEVHEHIITLINEREDKQYV